MKKKIEKIKRESESEWNSLTLSQKKTAIKTIRPRLWQLLIGNHINMASDVKLKLAAFGAGFEWNKVCGGTYISWPDLNQNKKG